MNQTRDVIVFLDTGTVDYGDLSFHELKKLGAFKAFPNTEPQEIEKRTQETSIVITNKCVFDAPLLTRLKNIKLISIAATGTNNVDLAAAQERRIAVTNVSGYSTETVVQFTFAFIVALATHLMKYNEASHDGRWSRSPFFTLPLAPVQEITGKILGIVGYGRIGERVAKIARIIGMKVLVAEIPGRTYPLEDKVKRVSFDSMIRHADFVTLHAPLTPVTQNLINREVLTKMKKGAFLINMARGGLVDEKALYDALQSGHLGGAATDVLTEEPPPANHILLKAPNLLMTPHIAWASREARLRLIHEMVLNIKAFQNGEKRNRVV